ncbi:arabinan endo-1,5-alpha-L-arabinosidase [Pontibacter qinzhouensis]|uniref:Arabinan endo-1,5-alpha-L-arabinosidase n=1 Tax=Pontibacter qinzhouensis TaxID=2603253 RepID=A0A5C8JME3_9BACT|nr:arabinan endo-1,5-alpha-L-arabinosidase [Pontibacter qinzhouensis]TXK38003.1 arabinan endo-1,5-alpha-L-arabinosidase [Pontibacter qinzhouensis]
MQHITKLILLLSLFLLNSYSFAQQGTGNSLKGDLKVHDPVMIKQGDTYYVFATGRGISIKTSKDRVNWLNAGRVFDSTSLPAWHRHDIPDQNGHLWAPDIHYADGKYHLYYSVSAWMNFNSSIGYATNTTLNPNDPAYNWIDEGQVISYKNGGEGVNVIDPNVFIDKNGKKYLVYGSYKAGLRIAELNPKTGKLLKPEPDLTTLTTSLGEGVYIVKGPAYYYIFASRGKCCAGLESNYQIVMGRSKTLQGPYLTKDGKSWIDNNYTVLLAGDHEEPGRGHNGIFAEGDTTYLVYHAYTRSANGTSLLNIKPLYMDEDDWPSLDPAKKPFKMDKFNKKLFIGK